MGETEKYDLLKNIIIWFKYFQYFYFSQISILTQTEIISEIC